MTSFKLDDGTEGILHTSTNPSIEIFTWCSDLDGQVPAEVHMITEINPQCRFFYQFHGPEVLTELINALILHRADVWPDYGYIGLQEPK